MDANVSKIMNLIDEMNDDQVKELLDYASFIVEDDKKGKLPKEETNPENGVPEEEETDELTVGDVERFYWKFKTTNPVSRKSIIHMLTKCDKSAESTGETFKEALLNEYEKEHG